MSEEFYLFFSPEGRNVLDLRCWGFAPLRDHCEDSAQRLQDREQLVYGLSQKGEHEEWVRVSRIAERSMKVQGDKKVRKYDRIREFTDMVCRDLNIPPCSVGYGYKKGHIAYYSPKDQSIILVNRSIRYYDLLHEVAHYVVHHRGLESGHSDDWLEVCMVLYRGYIEGYSS